MWTHLQVRKELVFLPIPDAVRRKLRDELAITPGTLPFGTIRGLVQDTVDLRDAPPHPHGDRECRPE